MFRLCAPASRRAGPDADHRKRFVHLSIHRIETMDQPNLVANALPRPISDPHPAPENAGAAASAAELSEQLFIALRERDLAKIHWILDQDHVDLSLKDDHGFTPLHFSMLHCPSEVFFSILHGKHDAHINEPSNDGYTPFITALCGCGKEDKLKMDALVEAQADINLPMMAPDAHMGVIMEISALQMAIQTKNAHGVKLLLDAGADVNQLTHDTCPLIFAAVIHQQPAIVKLLLDAKADLNAPYFEMESEKPGYNALHFAIEKSMKFNSWAADNIIKMLVQAGAEVDLKSIQLAENTVHIVDRLLEGKCKTPGEATILLQAAFDSVVSLFPESKGMEHHEFHIAGTMFSRGFYNVAQVFASAIHDGELKEKFISSSLQYAIDHNNYPAMDAMRNLGATLYQDLTKENTPQHGKKISKEIIQEADRQISAEARDEIFREICKEENHKYSHEKIATTNILHYLLYSICEKPEKDLRKPFTEDSTVLNTIEDKAFFHALMGAEMSYSHIETVIFSKLIYDEALENFLKNEPSMATPADGCKALEDSLDACAPAPEAEACLIALAPEH